MPRAELERLHTLADALEADNAMLRQALQSEAAARSLRREADAFDAEARELRAKVSATEGRA